MACWTDQKGTGLEKITREGAKKKREENYDEGEKAVPLDGYNCQYLENSLHRQAACFTTAILLSL